MTSKEEFTDDLIAQLVRTAIDLRRETGFEEGAAVVSSETVILGSILAMYFKKCGRRIAETSYAALDSADLTVEALAFSELWRRVHPGEGDLWETEEDDLN
ncbi:MAG: hypothetical protein KGI33_07430 [Thaumarchaeota archaeon]|nr:hypothetical protein [Nitrososphaerota archaeon]